MHEKIKNSIVYVIAQRTLFNAAIYENNSTFTALNQYGESHYFPLQQHYIEAYTGYLNWYDPDSDIVL